jgi:hypothetical protein
MVDLSSEERERLLTVKSEASSPEMVARARKNRNRVYSTGYLMIYTRVSMQFL